MEQNKPVVTTEINRMKQMWGWWRAKLNIALQSPWYASYLLRRFYDLMKALRPSKQLVASTVTGAALLVGSMALNPAPAHAATITVNSTADTAVSGDGNCTLREALTNANDATSTDQSGGDCLAGTGGGSDTIDLMGVSGTITLGSSLPYITNAGEHIVLNGPGASNLTIDGVSQTFGTIRSYGTGNNVIVDGLTIQGANGSGVNARAGNATVINSIIIGGGWDGIAAYNDIIVTNSVISGNILNGVWANVGGNITVVNSVISGNAWYGVAPNGNATVINSTVSGNGGSGISSYDANITVINSTITGNARTGIYASDHDANGAIVTLKNNLIIGNNASDVNCTKSGIPVTNGKNLINTHTGCTALAGEVTTIPVASIISPLANNGGSTQTHALVAAASNPAVNKGLNADSPGATDQRGQARIQGGTIDIGAFESAFADAAKAVGGVAELITPHTASPVTTTGVMATMFALLMGAGAWLMRRR